MMRHSPEWVPPPVGADLVRYVEDHLGLLLLWKNGTELRAAPKTEVALAVALASESLPLRREKRR